eukprot:SAG31_NODE_13234_length_883_cov_1.262755_1_plen_48_part_10
MKLPLLHCARTPDAPKKSTVATAAGTWLRIIWAGTLRVGTGARGEGKV